ncbi:ABC transporter permease [Micromonospora sp. NPDC092111]|uniref:ABC transporter permease n=1 Tax=Micromonospora sp. NPDC092111 TaxID=3364289 RepID=UPI00382E2EDA
MTSTAIAPVATTTDPGQRVLAFLARFGTLIVLGAMILGFGIARPVEFLSERNLINVLNQSALLAIVAAGLTYVLVAGQFDLSFANVVSFSGILCVGLMERSGVPVLFAVGGALLAAALVGVVNGILVAHVRINAIVATLGTSTVLLGLNFLYSNGAPITLGAGRFTEISRGRPGGIPIPVIIMTVVLVVLWVVLNRTLLGHHLQATGSNAVAARLAGVDVGRVTIAAFVGVAVCAGICGVLLSARIGSGMVTAGDGFLLSAFAAAFLGASVIRDGQFHILGTFVGVLVVSIAGNGLAILGAQSYALYLVQGSVLLAAVALSTTSRRLLGQDRR